VKWCVPHWQQLKDALAARDLMQFVAPSGEELVEKMATAATTASEDGDAELFEPLVACFMHINALALEQVGMRVMGECPFCQMVADGHPELVADWIDSEADGAMNYALQHGYLKRQ